MVSVFHFNLQTLKKEVMEEDEEKQINLLILGPLGAGKSSFINSIMSIGKNRHYNLAPTYFNTAKTWTIKVRLCYIYCYKNRYISRVRRQMELLTPNV
jgi:GTPase SAR1 family protein